MQKNPRVSILLPTHNGGAYIKQAIDSVLSQSFDDWELLVIDDGSGDNTKEIINSYAKDDSRIHYLKNDTQLGIQKTLNIGMDHARGEYIARIDADDAWIEEDKLERQVRFIDENNEYVVVGTGTVLVDEGGKELFRFLPREDSLDIKKHILKKNPFTHSSVLFKKNVAVVVGKYGEGEDVKHVEDYDLWLRMGRFGRLANLQTYATRFTLGPNSLSSKNKPVQLERGLLLAKKYGKDYPGGSSAVLYARARLVLYRLYRLFPKALKRGAFALYKKH